MGSLAGCFADEASALLVLEDVALGAMPTHDDDAVMHGAPGVMRLPMIRKGTAEAVRGADIEVRGIARVWHSGGCALPDGETFVWPTIPNGFAPYANGLADVTAEMGWARGLNADPSAALRDDKPRRGEARWLRQTSPPLRCGMTT